MRRALLLTAVPRALAGLLVAPLLPVVLTSGASAAAAAAPAPVLTWELSQQFDEHLGAHVLGDGATEDAAGVITFPGGVGTYDRATGAGSIAYEGSVSGSFVFAGATQYTISVSDPVVTVDAEGRGTISVVLASEIPSGSTADPGETEPERVVATTFDAERWVSGEGDVGSQGATPAFAGVLPAGSPEAAALGVPDGQPVEGRSWSPDFLGNLVPGVRAHFYASGASADAKKAPAPFVAQGIGVGVATEPEPDPVDALQWRVSPAFDATSETHAVAGGATETDQGVVTFPRTGGTYDAETGEATVSYSGSVEATNFEPLYPPPSLPFPNPLPNPDVERYSVTLADPVVTTDLAGNATVTALVSSSSELAAGAMPASTGPTRVEVVAFAAGVDPWVDGTARGRLVRTPTTFSAAFLAQLVAPARAQFATTADAAPDLLPAQLVAAAPPAPALTPATTVTTTSATPAGGLVLDVDGTGFRGMTRPGDTGIRVGLAPSGAQPAADGDFAAVALVPASAVVDHAFSTTLTVPTARLDPSRTYSLFTTQAPSRSTATQDTAVPVVVDFVALGLADPLEPRVRITPVATSDLATVAWDVAGTGFTAVTEPGDAGVYVGIAPAGGKPDVSVFDVSKFVAATWVMPGQIVEHAFTVRLSAERADLVGGTAYSVYTWQAHTNSNPGQDTETPLVLRRPVVLSTRSPHRKVFGVRGVFAVDLPRGASGSVTLSGLGARRTVEVVDGVARFRLSKRLPVGQYRPTIRYSGDTAFEPVSVRTYYRVLRARRR